MSKVYLNGYTEDSKVRYTDRQTRAVAVLDGREGLERAVGTESASLSFTVGVHQIDCFCSSSSLVYSFCVITKCICVSSVSVA